MPFLHAQEIFSIEDTLAPKPLSGKLYLLADSSKSLDAEMILADTAGTQFAFQPYVNFELPLSPQAVYWGKITITSSVDINNWWILFSGRFSQYGSGWKRGNGKVEVFSYEGDQIIHKELTGSNVPASQKAIPFQINISKVPFEIKAGESRQLLIRVEANSFNSPPDFEMLLAQAESERMGLGLFTRTTFEGYKNYLGMLFGALLMAFVYHLILFFYLRSPIYGWFALWLIFPVIAVGMSHPNDFITEYLIADFPMLRDYFWSMSTLMIWIVFWQFGRVFIHTHKKFPKLDVLIKVVIIVLSLNLLGGLAASLISGMSMFALGRINLPILGLTNITGIVISVILITKKDTLARYFGIGSIFANMGVIIGALWTAGVLRLTFDPFVTAIVFQTIIYSFGLAYKRQLETNEKQATERKLLISEREKAEQLQKVNKVTNRFVPSAFIRSIGKQSLLDVQLTDQINQEVTVFFSDIRSYTSISEKLKPEENFGFVRDYVQAVEPIIRKYNGFVHQFIGDGLMAIFDKDASDCLEAAIEMQAVIRQKFPDLKVGMGFHTGELVMGIIGNEDRMDVATISDAVNTASRMEGLTKLFGSNIVLSESSFMHLSNPANFHLRYLGKVQVKGKEAPIGIYECLDGLDKDQKTLKIASIDSFAEALAAYQSKNFSFAVSLLKGILKDNATDKAAKRILLKAKQLLREGVPEDWTGVEMMFRK